MKLQLALYCFLLYYIFNFRVQSRSEINACKSIFFKGKHFEVKINNEIIITNTVGYFFFRFHNKTKKYFFKFVIISQVFCADVVMMFSIFCFFFLKQQKLFPYLSKVPWFRNGLHTEGLARTVTTNFGFCLFSNN